MLHRARTPHRSWFYLLAAIVLTGFATPVTAQVVPDATLGNGNNSTTLINGIRTDIKGGLQRGSALFHSFERFGILTNHQVYFANPAGIRNIFSRVTGGSISNIDGLLGVSGGANLFFMNPNGIIFGPNARLDVSGSFLATTANVLQFADGQKFAADGDRAVPLVEVNIPIGLQYGANPPAMLTNRGNLATGQDLTLASNNLDLQGQLQAGGNLTLNATDTVKIRDTVTEPFIAQAGNKLLVQGDQQVDIFALNHPTSGLISGGDTVLRSANTVGGDAHFQTGGNFQIEQLNGNPGNLFSPFDPIVLAAGNVRIGNYTGASLHILAGGSVELGNVIINGTGPIATTINPNNANVIPGTTTPYSALSIVPLLNPDGTPATPITVNGNNQPTLDVRAGINWNALPFTGTPAIATPTAFPAGSVAFLPPTLLGANISTGSITVTQPNGLVLLTNQFAPNAALPASAISTNGAIRTNVGNGKAGNVVINASGNITAGGDMRAFVGTGGTGNGGDITLISRTGEIDTRASILFSSTASGNGGDVTLKAAGNIFTGGTPTDAGIQSFTGAGGTGNGGNILLQSTAGEINTTQGTLNSATGDGSAGNITIRAFDDIRTGNVTAFSDTDTGGFSTIRINSEQGSVILNQANLTTSNFGTAVAGDVVIDANGEIQVTNNSQIQSNGLFGQILIGSNSSVDRVTITNSSLSATVPNLTGTSTTPGRIRVTAGEIEVTNSSLNTQTSSTSANAGDISLTATGASVITNSRITSITNAGAGNSASNDIPNIQIQGASVRITGNSTVDASTEGLGQGGTVRLEATGTGLVTVEGSDILTRVGTTATGRGGDITIQGGSVAIAEATTEISTRNTNATSTQGSGDITIRSTSNSVNITNSPLITTNINGNGTSGDVLIRANQQVRVNNGATVQTRAFGDTGVAGDITIRAEAANGLAIRLENAAIDAASSLPNSGTGSVTIEGTNRGDVELIGQGFRPTIFTDTRGNQPTGELRVFGGNILIDRYQLNANVTASGVTGGNVRIDGTSVTMRNGSTISTETVGGRSGDIRIGSTTGDLIFAGGAIRTTVNANATGSGGDIAISSNGGQINFSNGFQVNAATNTTNLLAATERGGDIGITSKGGQITVGGGTAIDARTTGTQAGGKVEILSSGGALSVLNSTVNASTSGSNTGGAVSLLSGGGNLNLNGGSISTASSGTAGSGGDIAIASNGGQINFSNGFQVNSATSSQAARGEGGDVSISSSGGLIDINGNSAIDARTTGTQAGGKVEIFSSGGALSVLNSTVNASTSGSNTGGLVSLISGGGNLNLNGGSISTASSGLAGSGGDITIASNGGQIALNNGFQVNSATSSQAAVGGKGGNVAIASSNGQISVDGNSAIDASTSGTQRGGTVSVFSGNQAIQLNSGSISTTVKAGATADGGAISITSNSGGITFGNPAANTGFQVNAQTQATNTIGSSQTNGKGGNVAIASGTGDIALVANSTVTAGSTGTKDSGIVTLTGNNISLANSQISTSASGSGNAGNIAVAGSDVNLSASQIQASSSGSGGSGNVTVSGADISLVGGARRSEISTSATGAGASAGNVTLNAIGRTIILQNSDVLASSQQGTSGNINITARRLDLNNGTIKAEIGQNTANQSGSIKLDVSFRLTLENESEISTLGRNGANGGDISILNVRFLFGKRATGANGSDIVGRAEGGGRGGRVFLDRSTLVQGFLFRRAVDGNRTNDIDTNGQLDNFSTNADEGTRGLSKPLIIFSDVTQITSSACEAVGAKAATNSELRIAGRGGVASSPTAPLSAQTTTSDWVSLELSPQVPVQVTLPDGKPMTLEPGQMYQLQATCVNAWKEQQRSLL